MVAPGLVADGGRTRCAWCGADPLYRRYHDEEWGRPLADDRRLFETLCLEAFQSGLSWLTILRKRPAFRRAFARFDPERVARFGAREVQRLLADPGIVRHRGKVEAAVHNAARLLALLEERGSLAAYVWGFEPPAAERPRRATLAALARLGVPPSARALARDLRRRGWVWLGPTTCHAFLQAAGLVNDHLEGCDARPAVEAARRGFARPG